MELPAPKWFWPDWLPKGEVVLMAGKQGSNKSTLTTQLSQTIAEGGEFFDGTPAHKGRVLYYDLEASAEATGEKLRQWGWEQGDTSVDWCFLESIPFSTKRLEYFQYLLGTAVYDLAVIDTWRGLGIGVAG